MQNNVISFRRVGTENIDEVFCVLRQAPEYFRRVSGINRVTLETAQRELSDGPSKHVESYEKISLLVDQNNMAIGFIDLHKDHPAVEKCYIGLLLVIESLQGKGLGKAIYSHLEQWIKTNLNCTNIVLGVSIDNDVETFWKKMGYTRNEKSYTWVGENKSSLVYELEKQI